VGKRYLGLVGVYFDRESYRPFHKDLEDLKRKHLPYDPDEPPILHRKEIVNASGPFYPLQDDGKREAFNSDLLDLVKAADFKIVGVVIDKHTHGKKTYRSLTHPYHYCLQAMLERYCGWLAFKKRKGDVVAEARGKAENQALAKAYDEVWRTGTSFHGVGLFQGTLTTKQVKIKPKSSNIAGLQLADLLAHTVTREILVTYGRIQETATPFAAELGKIIRPKYNMQVYEGRIAGYGQVFLD
jgi:hypothetical protein